uniref:Uncharacterized protein n=1 Tax=Octopus bimaculoides TaxID=37653 RepID=A0A0L8GYJ7_OCTBM
MMMMMMMMMITAWCILSVYFHTHTHIYDNKTEGRKIPLNLLTFHFFFSFPIFWFLLNSRSVIFPHFLLKLNSLDKNNNLPSSSPQKLN